MASASLLNFTVPLSDLGVPVSGQGLIFPKLKYRFRVLLNGFGAIGAATTEITKQTIDFKRPTVSFEEQTIDTYNSKIHYAGKPTWSESALTLRDDMQGSVQTIVGQQMQKQFDFLNQASASSASDYKFELLCQMLDGGNGIEEPIILETWDLVGCFVKSADYDQVQYDQSGPVQVKLSIVFDNALQSASGIGSPVIRTNGISSI